MNLARVKSTRVREGPDAPGRPFTRLELAGREELKLCTSASEKDGAEVADDDRANLDCIGFTALCTVSLSKLVIGDSSLLSLLTSSVP